MGFQFEKISNYSINSPPGQESNLPNVTNANRRRLSISFYQNFFFILMIIVVAFVKVVTINTETHSLITIIFKSVDKNC